MGFLKYIFKRNNIDIIINQFVMTVSSKNKKFTGDEEYDPLDELNKMDDKFTSIETEKDPLDIITQDNVEHIPEYNSKLGSIVDKSDNKPESLQEENESSNDVKPSLLDIIDEVDINKNKSDIIGKIKKDIKEKPDLGSNAKKLSREDPSDKSSDTKIVDNVKVDEDGVPLLNQFNTNKLAGINILNKKNLTRLAMIIAGLIVVIIGVLEAVTEVIAVSDHVMYGEHESFAIGIIFLGAIIILLAFYNEIIKFLGLNSISNLDSDEVIPKVNNKDNKEK